MGLVLGGGAWKGWLYVEIWRGALQWKKRRGWWMPYIPCMWGWLHCGGSVGRGWRVCRRVRIMIWGMLEGWCHASRARRGGVRVVLPLYMEFNDVWHRG